MPVPPSLSTLESREGETTDHVIPLRVLHSQPCIDANTLNNASLINEVWIQMGDYQFNNNAYADALQMYKNVTDHDHSSNDIVYLNMAYCYQQLHQPQKALQSYSKHLSIHTDDIYCIHNIAVLHYYSKNYAQALQMYAKLPQTHMIQNALYFNIATCYMHQNDYDNALCYFQKHLRSHGTQNRNQCLISMAWIYGHKMNDPCKALQVYNTLNNAVISDHDLEFDIAYNYQNSQEYEMALKYYEVHLTKHPHDIDTLHRIAWIKVSQMNDFEGAKVFLLRILHRNKNHFYANYVYGLYLRDVVKDYLLSLQCLSIAQSAEPENTDVMRVIVETRKCLDHSKW
eukprot:80953_1